MQLIIFLKRKVKEYKLRKERREGEGKKESKRKDQRESEGGEKGRGNRLCRNLCGLLLPHCQDLQPTSTLDR